MALTQGTRIHDVVISDTLRFRDTMPPPDELAALMAERARVKEDEVRRAVMRVHPAAELLLLGLPDSHLAQREDALAQALAPLVGPRTLVVAPWRRDGHTDHESAGRVAARVAAAAGPRQRQHVPVDSERVHALRDLLGSSGWVERTRAFASTLRRSSSTPGGLLLVGTPTDEPWHLAAHLDDESRLSGVPELSPTLVRWAPPPQAPPHLSVTLARLEAAIARGDAAEVARLDVELTDLLFELD